jgi:signal peptidase II
VPDTDTPETPQAPQAAPGDAPPSPDPLAPSGGAEAGRRRGLRLLAVTASAVLAADAVTKVAVVATLSDRPPVKVLGGLLYLTQARNSGAAFGVAGGATVLLTLIAVVVVAVVLRTASRLRSVPWALCLGLILGGAAGNLVDRLARSPGPFRGAVVDWISVLDAHGGVWPIFNLADSAIVCGGLLAVVLATLGHEVDGRRADHDHGQDDHGRGGHAGRTDEVERQ